MMMSRPVSILALCVLFPVLSPYLAGQQREHTLKDDARELYNTDATVRAAAISRLVEAGPVAIPLLLPVMCDQSRPNFDVAWPSAAKALGELKAEAAVPCLVQMLACADVTLSVFKSEKTIANYDPAFDALVQIGEPAIPAIARYLPSLHPDQAYLALRVLRVINTPSAKAAVEGYINLLDDQTRLAKEVLADFQYGPGLTR